MDKELLAVLGNLRQLIQACILAIACAVLLVVSMWLGGAFLPEWADCGAQTTCAVPEGVRERLSGGWLVQDALCYDIDGDGSEECILLVWKRGSYGKHRPTWVSHDDAGFSQHIFIYKYSDRWRPIWMSSALSLQAASFEQGEMIAGTGRKSLLITAPDGSVSRWGWLSWGLTGVEDRQQEACNGL